jgi:hypothetical protein
MKNLATLRCSPKVNISKKVSGKKLTKQEENISLFLITPLLREEKFCREPLTTKFVTVLHSIMASKKQEQPFALLLSEACKIFNATNSLMRFENWKIFSCTLKNRYS